MPLARSLRGRTGLVLMAVALPVVILACLVAFWHNRELSLLKIDNAHTRAMVVAGRLEATLHGAASPAQITADLSAELIRQATRVPDSSCYAGSAVIDSHGAALAVTGTIPAPPWLARDPGSIARSADGWAIAKGLDGSRYLFVTAPVFDPDVTILRAYRADAFFGNDQRVLLLTIAAFAAIAAAVLLGATWAVDRSVIAWLGYLKGNAVPPDGPHPASRLQKLKRPPPEIVELAELVNRLADSAAGNAASVTHALTARDASLRELHHRVKNNFQVIASLLSLHKRVLPKDRRDDIRFLEEHVQSMAVAYRVVYATGDMARVRVNELIGEIVSGLRQIAQVPSGMVRLDLAGDQEEIGLDQAIAVGLYFAVVLPPYLDRAQACADVVEVLSTLDAGVLRLTIQSGGSDPVPMDPLRLRLRRAYIGQLHATEEAPDEAAREAISFRLLTPVA